MLGFQREIRSPQTGDTLSELEVKFPNVAIADVVKDEETTKFFGNEKRLSSGLAKSRSLQEAAVPWILGDPELDERDIRRCAKRLYGDEETPLIFERDDTGRYVDERAQRVSEAAVVGEVLQAIGRARLK